MILKQKKVKKGLGKIGKRMLLAVFSIFMVASFVEVYAGVGGPVTGWLWGGTGDGIGNSSGMGWISMNGGNVVGGADYSVDIPSADGNVSGYAWSENLGYINFDPVGPYPAGPAYSAKRVGDNLEGWARFEEIRLAGANAGGWLGWIKLKGANYGVSINSSDGKLSGYGWSDELGWIDFSRGAISVLDISLSASPGSCLACASLSPTLTASVNEPPTTITGNITYEFDCNSDGTAEQTYSNVSNLSQNYGGCTYTGYGAHDATVRITRGGLTETMIKTVNIIPPFCGNGVVEGSEECDEGGSNGFCPTATCSDVCTINSCQVESGLWREVAP